jgi:2',3'-cyclic-nucleotide 2'-phosphodiesterase (5'-nucleotidase family)
VRPALPLVEPIVRPLRAPLSYLLLLAASSGCVEFNECAAEGGVLLGRAAIDLDVRESVVRTQETAVGNLVADGLFMLADALCDETGAACPDLALQNAGGLRQETACGERDEISAGPIYQRDVTDLMPFENDLVVITMTGRAVKRALERSVSALGQAGEAAQAGFFLQVSGVELQVDCAQPAQTLAPDQSRIERDGERVVSARLVSRGRDEEILDDVEYEVATNSFIGSGNDGFLSFFFLDANNAVVTNSDGEPTRRLLEDDVVKDTGGTELSDRFAVTDWIRAHEDEDLLVGRPPEGRLNIDPVCYGADPEVELN